MCFWLEKLLRVCMIFRFLVLSERCWRTLQFKIAHLSSPFQTPDRFYFYLFRMSVRLKIGWKSIKAKISSKLGSLLFCLLYIESNGVCDIQAPLPTSRVYIFKWKLLFPWGLSWDVLFSMLVTSSHTEDGSLIPYVHYHCKLPATFTILFSHANAEDLGTLWGLPEDFIGRDHYFKWLSSALFVDVIGYEYPGYGLCT